MNSRYVLLLGMLGCEILKTVTDVRLQVLESRPLWEFSSFPTGLDPSCNCSVQGYLKPRFNRLKLEVRTEILIVEGIPQE